MYLKVRPAPEAPDFVLAWFEVSTHEDRHGIVGDMQTVRSGVALGLALESSAFYALEDR